jgi:hypothetical protein
VQGNHEILYAIVTVGVAITAALIHVLSWERVL